MLIETSVIRPPTAKALVLIILLQLWKDHHFNKLIETRIRAQAAPTAWKTGSLWYGELSDSLRHLIQINLLKQMKLKKPQTPIITTVTNTRRKYLHWLERLELIESIIVVPAPSTATDATLNTALVTITQVSWSNKTRWQVLVLVFSYKF